MRLRESGVYAILREYDKSRRDKNSPLHDGKFMTLDGTPEWNLLMNTLLLRDNELDVDDTHTRPHVPSGITDFDIEQLSRELKMLESDELATTNIEAKD